MAVLNENIKKLKKIIRDCTLCPWQCHVDRTAGQIGACRIGAQAVVASYGPHFGEEPVLVGRGGSGTIFLSGCNLDCAFCQNFDISHSNKGQTLSPKEIADIALDLQKTGCVNVNFVTPTHVAHSLAEAIAISRKDGLTVPIVYNCGGYESVETLKLLDGLIEIYMPDFKYADADAARKYSGVKDYPEIAKAALAEMYRQVGPLELDKNGVATSGLLVRHLVLPNNLTPSSKVMDIIAEVAPGCAINVMGQYRPAFRASNFPELMDLPSGIDVANLRSYASSKGLMRVD